LDLQQFCDNLKSARLYQEMELIEISRETRISVGFLTALEDGDWHLIPPGYLRGYLSNYAESVGMNLERVLESFTELEWEPPEPDSAPVLELESQRPALDPASTRIPGLLEAVPLLRWLLFAVAALVLVLIGGGILMLFDSTPPPEIVQEEPVVVRDTVSRSEPQPDSTVFSIEKVNLAFAFTDSCYLKVGTGDSLIKEWIYLPGDSIAFTSEGQLQVTVGNPQAAILYFNGRSSGKVGQTNQPAHLVVDPAGVQHSSLGVLR